MQLKKDDTKVQIIITDFYSPHFSLYFPGVYIVCVCVHIYGYLCTFIYVFMCISTWEMSMYSKSTYSNFTMWVQ